MLPTMRMSGGDTDGLMELVALLPRGGEVVEVGCYAGESTRLWLSRAGKIWGVDPWASYRDVPGRLFHSAAEMADAEVVFDALCREFVGRVFKVRQRSVDARRLFTCGSVDAVYLDGAHDYASVVRDIVLWRSVVKLGGLVCGHDYGRAQYPGVARAVVNVLGGPDCVFPDSSWMKRCVPFGRGCG